jgi:hypothetical protein
MERPVLFALATATLVQSLDESYDNESVEGDTGSVAPYDVAYTSLKLWQRDDDLKRINRPSKVFEWAFNYGLQLGAAIAERPGQIHNVTEITKPLMLAIEDAIYEQAKNERDAA